MTIFRTLWAKLAAGVAVVLLAILALFHGNIAPSPAVLPTPTSFVGHCLTFDAADEMSAEDMDTANCRSLTFPQQQAAIAGINGLVAEQLSQGTSWSRALVNADARLYGMYVKAWIYTSGGPGGSYIPDFEPLPGGVP